MNNISNDTDRFIPCRSSTFVESNIGRLRIPSLERDEIECGPTSEYCDRLHHALFDRPRPKKTEPILQYSPIDQKVSHAWSFRFFPEEPHNYLKVRAVDPTVSKALDAPQLIDDFYVHHLAPTSDGFTLLLENCAYTYSLSQSKITSSYQNASKIVSVATLLQRERCAIGDEGQNIALVDMDKSRIIRSYDLSSQDNNNTHIPSVIQYDKNHNGLIYGVSSGDVFLADMRSRSLKGRNSVGHHDGNICNIALHGWKVAVGDNANQVKIWDLRRKESGPLHIFRHHKSAVRGLAWAPWNPRLLLTGGGISDKRVCLVDTVSHKVIASLSTDGQVSEILPSENQLREIVVSQGYPSGVNTIWKAHSDRSFIRVRELQNDTHGGRVLSSVLTENGSTLASVVAGERLLLWNNLFPQEKKKTNSLFDKSLVIR